MAHDGSVISVIGVIAQTRFETGQSGESDCITITGQTLEQLIGGPALPGTTKRCGEACAL
jgi:hypothetical protein